MHVLSFYPGTPEHDVKTLDHEPILQNVQPRLNALLISGSPI